MMLQTNCEGMSRRNCLQLGLGGLAAGSVVDLLRLKAQAETAAAASGKPLRKPMSCILVWLDGGPSHYETFDPKPEAPREIAGEFKPFADRANGVHYFDNLAVLKAATMPALLLEAGVIVNRDEELQLQDPARVAMMAASVARGVAQCLAPRK